MRPEVWRTVLFVICFFAAVARAQNPDLTGRWQVSITHYGQNDYGRVTLKADGARWTGEMFGDAFTVTLDGSAIEVRCQERDQKGKHCGVLKGRLSEGVMSAAGNLYDQESTWTARRAPTIERSSARHEFVPKVYHNQFSGQIEPALRIRPAKPSMRRPWTLEVWMRTERTSPRAGIL